MKISICASMVFAEEQLKAKEELEALGHEVLVSEFIESYIGKDEKQKEEITLFHKNEKDAMKEHWEKIKVSDAILVLNFDRRGVKNYIGGNTLLEIGFAYVLDKKIFLLNPVPDIQFYKSEIEATKPVILNGNLLTI